MTSNTVGNTVEINPFPDDSGRWGYGGLFSALDARSMNPEDGYTQAGNMKGTQAAPNKPILKLL